MSQDVKDFVWLANEAAPMTVMREAVQCTETPDNDNTIYTSCEQEKCYVEKKKLSQFSNSLDYQLIWACLYSLLGKLIGVSISCLCIDWYPFPVQVTSPVL